MECSKTTLRLGRRTLRSPTGPCEIWVRQRPRLEAYVKRLEKLFAVDNAPSVVLRGSKPALDTVVAVASEFLRRNPLFVSQSNKGYAVALEDSVGLKSGASHRAVRVPLLEVVLAPPSAVQQVQSNENNK